MSHKGDRPETGVDDHFRPYEGILPGIWLYAIAGACLMVLIGGTMFVALGGFE